MHKLIKFSEVVILFNSKERFEGEEIYLHLESTAGANPDKGVCTSLLLLNSSFGR
jgi:hypothetical protein